MSTLEEVRGRFQRLSIENEAAKLVLDNSLIEQTAATAQADTLTQTTALLKRLMREAQQGFKDKVDDVVTMAVKSLFDEDFSFDLEIKTGGASLQCRPVIWEHIEGHAEEYNPADEMGGSIMDPIGLALRVALQQTDPEPTRSTFWLDEPMKNVGKGELLLRAGQLVAEISHGLKVQIIIITHEPELAEIADRAWRVVRKRNGRSAATVIKGGTQKRQLVT
jgi:hypothetical protein